MSFLSLFCLDIRIRAAKQAFGITIMAIQKPINKPSGNKRLPLIAHNKKSGEKLLRTINKRTNFNPSPWLFIF
jgi:hypothetical protein